MADTRRKNVNWRIDEDYQGRPPTDHAQLAVLMDLRDELQRLNTLLSCSNCIDIPNILRRIDVNTEKRRHTKKKATA